MQLKMIKCIAGLVDRHEGDIVDYLPWKFEFQDMSEPERVERGIFVHCYGHGEFEVLREDDDVKRV